MNGILISIVQTEVETPLTLDVRIILSGGKPKNILAGVYSTVDLSIM